MATRRNAMSTVTITSINSVATHNGPFHADDCLAVALIQLVNPSVAITRTRDEKLVAAADVVVDVGGVFDPSHMRFDHHQFRSATERLRSRHMPAIPLSSAGMVLEWLEDDGILTAAEAKGLYRDLVAEIDLHDNGEGGGPLPHGGLSSAISRFNPTWDGGKDFDGAFTRAVEFCQGILRDALASVRADIRAVAVVADSPSVAGGKILVMNKSVPGAREIALDLALPCTFIVHPSDFGGWMVMTVPPSREDAFGQRVPLPAAWAGLRGAALNAALLESGVPAEVLEAGTAAVPSAVFCHTGRFCGGHGTEEAAIAMAVAALG